MKGFQAFEKGILFKNHTNKGGAKVQPGDQVTYHGYEYKNGDSLISSSAKMGQPVVMVVPPAEAQKGNTMLSMLAKMAKGDSLSFVIPIDSLPQINPPYKKGDRLFISLVMLDVKPAAEVEKEKAVMQEAEKSLEAALVTQTADYKSGKLKPQATASGLKYIIAEQGTGKKAEIGSTAVVNYIGVLPDGKKFDSSYSHGSTFSFQIGKGMVIPGWDEGVAMLNEGGKATFFIPSQLGYGEQGQGPIPPNSELVFYVELKEVK